MAYGISVAGSDWNEIKVRDIDSGNELTDHITEFALGGIERLRRDR